jgi:hypothetical protein
VKIEKAKKVLALVELLPLISDSVQFVKEFICCKKGHKWEEPVKCGAQRPIEHEDYLIHECRRCGKIEIL